MSFTRFLSIAAILLVGVAPASAQNVKLDFHDGRVSLVTQNASLRAILAEWARLGGTTVVNGERVGGAPLTIELIDVTEQQALDVILRSVSGYMAAARPTGTAGVSAFDRIMIVPSTNAAARPVTPVFGQPGGNVPGQAGGVQNGFQRGVQAGIQQVPQFNPDDAEENPPDDIPPQEIEDQDGPPNPRVRVRPPRDFVPPMVNGRPIQPQPFQPQPDDQNPEEQPTPPANNPFGLQPGSSRPGVISPQPQQQNRTPSPAQP